MRQILSWTCWGGFDLCYNYMLSCHWSWIQDLFGCESLQCRGQVQRTWNGNVPAQIMSWVLKAFANKWLHFSQLAWQSIWLLQWRVSGSWWYNVAGGYGHFGWACWSWYHLIMWREIREGQPYSLCSIWAPMLPQWRAMCCFMWSNSWSTTILPLWSTKWCMGECISDNDATALSYLKLPDVYDVLVSHSLLTPWCHLAWQ